MAYICPAAGFSPTLGRPDAVAVASKCNVPSSGWHYIQSKLHSRPEKLGGDEEENAEDEEPELMTNEKFYRELMGLSGEEKQLSPKRKKKRKQRPHDNRDQLPFLVQVLTPPKEPYKVAPKKKKSKKKKRESASSEDYGVVGETLGEFRFEKNTNTGDKIEIDNEVYLVQRSKCQYKYAGAQKFVMVRKILQVKPIQRAMQEDYILRQWNASPAPESE